MTLERNKQTTNQLFKAFSSGDVKSVMDLFAEDGSWTILGKPELTPSCQRYDVNGFGELFNIMLTRLENDLKMTIKGMVAEGEKVAVEAESYGPLKNGRVYQQTYHILLEFRDGKIAAAREYLDTHHVHDVWYRA